MTLMNGRSETQRQNTEQILLKLDSSRKQSYKSEMHNRPIKFYTADLTPKVKQAPL